MLHAAVFLDRDNTIIENDGDLGDPAQVKLIQGAASAIASLRGLGYRIIVVTNQGGVARGKYTEADVDKVHQRINEMVYAMSGVTIDRFYYCPFHPEATVERYRREHPWRKPQPGMLLEAAKDMGLDLGQSWMIGDQKRDVDAGRAANVRTILLHPDAVERPPLGTPDPSQLNPDQGSDHPSQPQYTARNLIDAVKIVAQQRKPIAIDENRRAEDRRRWLPAVNQALNQNKPASQSASTVTSPSGAIPTDQGVAVATTTVHAPSAPPAASPKAEPRPIQGQRGPLTEPIKITNTVPPIPTPTLRNLPTNAGGATVQTSAPVAPAKPIAPASSSPPAPAVSSNAPAAPASPKPVNAPNTIAATATLDSPDESDAQGATASATITDDARPPATASPTANHTLRQILQELRNQRGIGREFSYLDTLAIILQMLAAVCLIGAIWMGRENDEVFTFIRWIGAGILIQLATIATLLFRRKT